MSDQVLGYLRWLLAPNDAPKVDATALGVETVTSAAICAFAVALERMFGEDATPDKIREFVKRVRENWVAPEGLNPILAERIILSAFGEEDLIRDVPTAEVHRVENMIAYGVVREKNIVGDDFEEFIHEVLDLMNEPIDG